MFGCSRPFSGDGCCGAVFGFLLGGPDLPHATGQPIPSRLGQLVVPRFLGARRMGARRCRAKLGSNGAAWMPHP